MQPYTMHIVMTPAPTICHGGHFFSAFTMERTLHARQYEHIYPDSLSNEAHTGATGLIHRMMIYAAWKILDCNSPSPYPLGSLSALFLMCQHPGSFLNHLEKLPSDLHSAEIQEKKAHQAAAAVRKRYVQVQEMVATLEERLTEW